MKYDVCCLGSALVDITFHIDDNFSQTIEEKGITKGGMTLIEKDDQINLIQELVNLGKSPVMACGGSATNSIVAASLFGSSCHMSCIVSNDENGRFYLEDLLSNGVSHTSKLIDSELSSGQCLVMISDDAERTMCTNLGINSNISASNVNQAIIKNSDYIFLEGYLIASPEGYNAFNEAITQAKKHNTKVALSLSDAFIVKSFKKELKELIKINCDLIFCNESEAQEFSGNVVENEILTYFKSFTPNLVITKGSDGCIGYEGNYEFSVPGEKVKAIDTNGAGDMFAGAVLNGLKNKKNLEESAKFGCFAASKIVQENGPRLSKKDYSKIKETFTSN
jgi:sugar/nucleoside kinase (ribokinase family)